MKVLMVINTTGLEYDDRLRKEALSLRRLGFDVEILAMEYANQAGRRVVYGCVPARTIRLRSRGWFARSKGLWLKASEMHAKFLVATAKARPDVIWFHNMQLSGLAPFFILARKFGLVKRLIWDQHELPSDRVLHAPLLMRVIASLYNGCDVIVEANIHRKHLLESSLGSALQVPVQVLHNYPDQHFVDLPQEPLPENVRHWLGGKPYVLAQGGAAPDRHFEVFVSAVLDIERLKLIVVGPYQESQIRKLAGLYGPEWAERVLLTGFIAQMDITSYIDHALASVVLYEILGENQRLCASNRLYQGVSRGTPVVVGANPPMAEFVGRWRCGIVLSGTGGDTDDVRSGIECVLNCRREFKSNIEICRFHAIWESQMGVIQDIVGADST